MDLDGVGHDITGRDDAAGNRIRALAHRQLRLQDCHRVDISTRHARVRRVVAHLDGVGEQNLEIVVRKDLVHHAGAIDEHEVAVVGLAGDRTETPSHRTRSQGRIARHVGLGHGWMDERRCRAERRRSRVAVDAGGPFEGESLGKGVDEFEIAEGPLRHGDPQCIFDDVPDANGGIVPEGVQGAALGDGGFDIPRRDRRRDRLGDVVVESVNAVRTVALEGARPLETRPLRRDAVREDLVGEDVVEHPHIVGDGNGGPGDNVDIGVAMLKAPDQDLRGVHAVAGHNRLANGVAGSGDGRVAGISQAQIEFVDDRHIECIRIAPGGCAHRHAVAHDLSGRRRIGRRALRHLLDVRLDDADRHGFADQRRAPRCARVVGVGVGDGIFDVDPLMGAGDIAHPRPQFDKNLLTRRNLGDGDPHLLGGAGVGHQGLVDPRHDCSDIFEIRIERVDDLDVVESAALRRLRDSDRVGHLLAYRRCREERLLVRRIRNGIVDRHPRRFGGAIPSGIDRS